MEHAKRLYLIDEFDRQYKQLQRPAAFVAKARSALRLSKTLRSPNLNEKARMYIAELHRYLNVRRHRQQQQQQRQAQKRKRATSPTGFNTATPTPVPRRAVQPALGVTTRRQAAAAAAIDADVESDDDDSTITRRSSCGAQPTAANIACPLLVLPSALLVRLQPLRFVTLASTLTRTCQCVATFGELCLAVLPLFASYAPSGVKSQLPCSSHWSPRLFCLTYTTATACCMVCRLH